MGQIHKPAMGPNPLSRKSKKIRKPEKPRRKRKGKRSKAISASKKLGIGR
jgi:hypothetical protein